MCYSTLTIEMISQRLCIDCGTNSLFLLSNVVFQSMYRVKHQHSTLKDEIQTMRPGAGTPDHLVIRWIILDPQCDHIQQLSQRLNGQTLDKHSCQLLKDWTAGIPVLVNYALEYTRSSSKEISLKGFRNFMIKEYQCVELTPFDSFQDDNMKDMYLELFRISILRVPLNLASDREIDPEYWCIPSEKGRTKKYKLVDLIETYHVSLIYYGRYECVCKYKYQTKGQLLKEQQIFPQTGIRLKDALRDCLRDKLTALYDGYKNILLGCSSMADGCFPTFQFNGHKCDNNKFIVENHQWFGDWDHPICDGSLFEKLLILILFIGIAFTFVNRSWGLGYDTKIQKAINQLFAHSNNNNNNNNNTNLSIDTMVLVVIAMNISDSLNDGNPIIYND
ncbi:hypothetical protein DFA_02409 [Cavenderia fasciculata]|uniref:Uncharacterized protein n=1 Tax=Cavenderia fasciculata TaxID=261658 RepID=F4PZD2_CACFS|nr:uncharacterized protein DFA_02409 [Cavenderia fasciculata]EGG19161.1 hypothetical protein DFA_02409 [Cavenderia fasciculata]|eukprot:XP_004366794.1 hypothetical protein DFA_02409 [Cavenderia fasciculata]